ncbi:hypothetical protein LCGC14_1157270 [marine sediment metagenome]|uniref:Uncharacterized protein n=1 Tax=marine sediment metagenome TaxID=412755 RepID=A0A0F9PC01_9ZZZZ
MVATQVVTAHEPYGKCHRPYNPPDECKHDCDHEFCDCSDPCLGKCKVNNYKNCYSQCVYACLIPHVECINGCGE